MASVGGPPALTDVASIASDGRLSRLRVVAFDLDDTLAPSKCRLEDPIVAALASLLDRWEVCIISGGSVEQFEEQVLASGSTDWDLARLHLMPTCGTQYLRWAGQWSSRYAETLTPVEKQLAIEALERSARLLGYWEASPWGARIEDRGTQITFSALGQQAPVEAKRSWDPNRTKRRRLRDVVQQRLADLEVRVGGSTSLDVTRKGIDKAYGMRKLAGELDVGFDDMLFVGDRLEPGGNDFPVRSLGMTCVAVRGWHDTLEVIARLIAARCQAPPPLSLLASRPVRTSW